MSDVPIHPISIEQVAFGLGHCSVYSIVATTPPSKGRRRKWFKPSAQRDTIQATVRSAFASVLICLLRTEAALATDAVAIHLMAVLCSRLTIADTRPRRPPATTWAKLAVQSKDWARCCEDISAETGWTLRSLYRSRDLLMWSDPSAK